MEDNEWGRPTPRHARHAAVGRLGAERQESGPGRGPRRVGLVGLAALAALLAAACGGGSSSTTTSTAATGGGSSTAAAAGTPVAGGDLVIARTADSTTMDKTLAFDNEAIWVFQQMFETLYVVTPDGKGVKPWLAESFDLSADKLSYTFHLRHGVKFHNGNEMTSADVKFSIDDATAAKDGWGYLNAAIDTVTAPDPYTVVVKTKYPWAPLVADLALFSNGIVPKDFGGVTKDQFYANPVGTGPFKWDHWTKKQEPEARQEPRLLAGGQALPQQRHVDRRRR